MSPTREPIALTPPVATTWRASSYQWGPDEAAGQPQSIEASSKASWRRVDVFGAYKPSADKPLAPHTSFLVLRDVKEVKRNYEMYNKVLWLFVHNYGLLGLFNEYFAPPILPSRVGDLFSRVLPDTVLDQQGRMHAVDPATEGKEFLEALLYRRHGLSRRTGKKLTLSSEYAALPHELSFSSRRAFSFFAAIASPLEVSHSATYPWSQVRDLYGIRAMLDEQARSGVSIISTCEPLAYWASEIKNFPVPPCSAGHFNSHTWDVHPHAITGEDGELQRSWRCSSLLQAMYLMLYLDETGDEFEIRKCEAPNCPEYFRVRADDGRSKRGMYCPPAPGRKQSKCATRASSKMYRERQRRKS